MAETIPNIPLYEEFPEVAPSMEATADKPFNQCLSCEFFRNGCSGPNLRATTVEREREFLQLCRLKLGYSYQKIADLCDLSVITVKRILTGQVKDPGAVSMRALNNILVSDPNGKSPCALHLVSKRTEEAVAECQKLRDMLDSINVEHKAELIATHLNDAQRLDYLKEQIRFKEEQLKAKDKILEERYEFMKRKDKIIAILAIGLATTLLLIIATLLIDRFNP